MAKILSHQEEKYIRIKDLVEWLLTCKSERNAVIVDAIVEKLIKLI
jgi:hypothetical protein